MELMRLVVCGEATSETVPDDAISVTERRLREMSIENLRRFDGLAMDCSAVERPVSTLLRACRFLAPGAVIELTNVADEGSEDGCRYRLMRALAETAVARIEDFLQSIANDDVFVRESAAAGCVRLRYRGLSDADFCFLTMTLGSDYADTVRDGTRSKIAYARALGLRLHVAEEVPEGLSGRPLPWAKVLLLREHLLRHRYVLYVDADTVVMDDAFSPELLVSLMRPGQSLMLAHDFNDLNTGVVLARRCDETDSLLQRMWERMDCVHDPWWEQRALIRLYEEDPAVREAVSVIPEDSCNLINAYECRNYRPGNWLVHFAGVRYGLREMMRAAWEMSSLNSKRGDRGSNEIVGGAASGAF